MPTPTPLLITGLADLEILVGQEVGVTDWLVISQEQVNQFAAATLDFQWIHTDPVRAAAESPFGGTIAHGYLTVALLPYFWNQLVTLENLKMQVNYEVETLRFNQAVVVGMPVRLRATVLSVSDLRGIIKTRIGVKMEIEGQKKPAYTGVVTFLYHFEG